MRLSLILSCVLIFLQQAHPDSNCLHVPFTDSGAPPVRQYERPRQFDFKHMKLEVRVDLEKESVAGTVTHTLAAIGAPRSMVEFDAVNLDVTAVRVNDHEAEFENTGQKVVVTLPEQFDPETEASIAIEYITVRPEAGMHFRTERMGYSAKEAQAWSQGQSMDTRYWIPCFDYPNERATTEVIATVEAPLLALSNGDLVSTTDNNDGTRTFHWQLNEPHVAYLVSLVVGQFEEIREDSGPVPNYYYVPLGKREEGERAFARTPEMMNLFGEITGITYPYGRYSQVVVKDFIAGGMENITISTLAEWSIYDEAAGLTHTADWLIAHELAHQWFGDLITCRDWAHLWLNEGFATYFEVLWREHAEGPDAAQYDLWRKATEYFDVDKPEMRAPVVQKRYGDVESLFNARVYEKGAWTLHMLRHHLGDERFFACLKTYTERYRGSVVDTNNFWRTFEEVSGEGLERFLEQWLYRGGYPQLEVAYEWEEEQKRAKVSVRQAQQMGENELPYSIKTSLLFQHGENRLIESIEIDEVEETYYVSLDARPEFVQFDPDYVVLCDLKFDKGKDMSLAQLKSGSTFVGRLEALAGLRTHADDDIVAAIADLAKGDAYWGLRAEAALTLGKMDTPAAEEALLAIAEVDEPHVRRAAAQALVSFDSAPVREKLEHLAANDAATYVASEAVASLGKMRAQESIDVIVAALDRPSHNEAIRQAALDALVSMGDARQLPPVLALLDEATPPRARMAAVNAAGELGRLAAETDPARMALEELLNSTHARIRGAAIGALATMGDARAIPALRAFAAKSQHKEQSEAARKTAEELRAGEGLPKAFQGLQEQVRTLEEENAEMEQRLEKLEQNLDSVLKQQNE